jgi:hypothetical protein
MSSLCPTDFQDFGGAATITYGSFLVCSEVFILRRTILEEAHQDVSFLAGPDLYDKILEYSLDTWRCQGREVSVFCK